MRVVCSVVCVTPDTMAFQVGHPSGISSIIPAIFCCMADVTRPRRASMRSQIHAAKRRPRTAPPATMVKSNSARLMTHPPSDAVLRRFGAVRCVEATGVQRTAAPRDQSNPTCRRKG